MLAVGTLVVDARHAEVLVGGHAAGRQESASAAHNSGDKPVKQTKAYFSGQLGH